MQCPGRCGAAGALRWRAAETPRAIACRSYYPSARNVWCSPGIGRQRWLARSDPATRRQPFACSAPAAAERPGHLPLLLALDQLLDSLCDDPADCALSELGHCLGIDFGVLQRPANRNRQRSIAELTEKSRPRENFVRKPDLGDKIEGLIETDRAPRPHQNLPDVEVHRGLIHAAVLQFEIDVLFGDHHEGLLDANNVAWQVAIDA